jgi:8-oxo-dGTP diphosphatase
MTKPGKRIEPAPKPKKARPGGEAEFLAEYRAEDYPRPSVAVDIVVFTIRDSELEVLLIRRKNHPFKGAWALPGGFVQVADGQKGQGEDLDEAAVRRLSEETRLPRGSVFLEQLYTFGKADRDPRTRVITVAYYALVRPDLAPFVGAGVDATDAGWKIARTLDELELAFDHRTIVETAVERIRGKLDYSDIAFELVPEHFSIPELRAVYEVIIGKSYDPGNFRRKFNRMLDEGIIERTPGKRITASKPAQVFRFKRGART